MNQEFAFKESQSFLDLSGIESFERLAAMPADLVLEGETGTGKDSVARGIHRYRHASSPFVNVNCAAIPEALIESELFGVEAGAYTGAIRARPGKIEAADGGMLYLDEIDSMSLHHQAKLLNVLQYRGSVRLGGNTFRKSSFRLVTSTKIPLDLLVQRGLFRKDLFFRLNTLRLQLPPLRRQPERIIPTFYRMLEAHAARFTADVVPLAPREREALLAHPWPGNYRELLGCAIRRLCGNPMLEDMTVMDVAMQEAAQVLVLAPMPLKEKLRAFEMRLITMALDSTGGNVAKAAAQLRVSPQTLHYRIHALKLPDRSQILAPRGT